MYWPFAVEELVLTFKNAEAMPPEARETLVVDRFTDGDDSDGVTVEDSVILGAAKLQKLVRAIMDMAAVGLAFVMLSTVGSAVMEKSGEHGTGVWVTGEIWRTSREIPVEVNGGVLVVKDSELYSATTSRLEADVVSMKNPLAVKFGGGWTKNVTIVE